MKESFVPVRGRMFAYAGVAFASVVFALCVLHWSSPSVSEPPNLLLIVVDTLRADRLGAYGLYDVAADPQERNPAPEGNGPAPLEHALVRFREHLDRRATRVDVIDEDEIDHDTRERLRALGYAQ